MNIIRHSSRREFIEKGGVLVAVASGVGSVGQLLAGEEPKRDKEKEEVSPAEDLMREHGVLKRVLLIYGKGIRRIEAKESLPPETIADAA